MAARPEAVAFAEKHNATLKKAPDAPGVGHNSAPDPKRSYFDRLLALEQEKKNLSDDIRDLKAEAKEQDVNPRALSVLVKREMEDADQKAKREALAEAVDSYAVALGLLL